MVRPWWSRTSVHLLVVAAACSGSRRDESSGSGTGCRSDFDCPSNAACFCSDEDCNDGVCRTAVVGPNDPRDACQEFCDWHVGCGEASSADRCWEDCADLHRTANEECEEVFQGLASCLDRRIDDCNALETACACDQAEVQKLCAPNAPNSCRYARDGFCDEPELCDEGTDTDDCLGSSSCETAFNGRCDEPVACPPGTDGNDCTCGYDSTGGTSGNGGTGGTIPTGGTAGTTGGVIPIGGTGTSGTAGEGGDAAGGQGGAAGRPSGGAGGAMGGVAGTGGSGGRMGGGVGGGGAGGMMCGSRVAAANDTAIDDLEDRDHVILPPRVGFWYTFNDLTCSPAQVPPPDPSGMIPFPPTATTTAGGSGAYAARTTGGPCSTWGAGLGFDLNNCGARQQAYDASVFNGISFWYRSTTPLRVIFLTTAVISNTRPPGTCVPGGTGMECDNGHGADLPASASGRVVSIPFSTLTQLFGQMKAFDKMQIVNVQWQVAQGVAFDFSVDDVVFVP